MDVSLFDLVEIYKGLQSTPMEVRTTTTTEIITKLETLIKTAIDNIKVEKE